MDSLHNYDHLSPGTPTFFPALLAHIRDIAPPSLPVDAVVFQSLLLCLVAGDKHLLLRAPEKDVRLVVKLAFLCLDSIFGLPTHKLKVRPRFGASAHTSDAPTAIFLRSSFLPWTPFPDNPRNSQDETLSSNTAKTTLGSRNRNRNNATWDRSSSRSGKRRQFRAMSSPNDITSSGTIASNPFGDHHEWQFLPTASASVNVTANPTLSSSTRSKVRAPLPHSFSDPTPLRPRQGAVLQPQALVISGLENATIPSQRALTKVLAEKRIVLDDEDEDGFLEDEGYNEVWNLPDGFIMVYVCPINAHERPGIHKTLLDKFAMSATVSPHHSLRALLLSPSHNSNSYRNSPALHTSPLPQGQTGTSTSSPPFLAQPLPLPHHGHPHPLAIHHHLYHHPLTQQPLVPPTLLSDLRATYSRTHMSPSLSLYASDLFSATRHHPQLDGTLLTAKSLKDTIDLARASRVIGGDLTGMELVRDDAADLAVKAHTLLNVNENGSAKHDHDLEDERDDPGTPGPPGREKAKGDAHRYQPIEVVVEEADMSTTPVPEAESFHSEVAMPPELLEVSEADIARIVPRVLTHRLRVRDGPKDEVLGSAMFPAVPAVGDDDGIALDHGSQRSTVKEILIKILAEV